MEPPIFRDDDELYRRLSDIPSATIGNLGGSLLAEDRERKEDNSDYGYATGGVQMQDDNQVVDASKSLFKVASYDVIVYALISKTYCFIGNDGADRWKYQSFKEKHFSLSLS